MSGDNGHRDGLSDLQRRGIATAMEVFDGLLSEVGDGRRPRMDEALDGHDGGPADFPALRAAVARTIDLYAELFRRTLEVYADAVENVLRSGGPAPHDSAGGVEVALTGAPGTDAIATVWIHNTTAAPVRALRVHMTDLTAHDGARIDAAAAAFDPPLLDVGADASRSASLSVRIPADAAPGAYVGHILATGLPGTRLAVSLVVAS